MTRLFLLSTLVIFISSCKKKDHPVDTPTETQPSVTYTSYSKLNPAIIGYGRFQVNADGTVSDKQQYDSC